MLIENIYSTDEKLLKLVAKLNSDWERFHQHKLTQTEKLEQLEAEISDCRFPSKKTIREISEEIRNLRFEIAESAKIDVQLLERKNEILNQAITSKIPQAEQLRKQIQKEIEQAKERLTKIGSGVESIPAGGVGISRMIDANPQAAQNKFEHLARQTEPVRDAMARAEEADGQLRTLIQQRANCNLLIDSLIERFQKMVKSI
jgi:predicted  nucleic acid-binding Zn-ribbon protein